MEGVWMILATVAAWRLIDAIDHVTHAILRSEDNRIREQQERREKIERSKIDRRMH